MKRFETRVENGTLSIEGSDGWIHVGPFDEIVDELGEEYEIEYDEAQSSVPWLETDDGVLTVDVPEVLEGLSYDEEFVELLADSPKGNRVDFFTDMLRRIWDSKGNLEEY